MRKSYLANIDNRGLRALYEEHEHTCEFLNRQILNRDLPASAIVWTVLSTEFIGPIRTQLALGNSSDAWLLLHTVSTQLGTVQCDFGQRFRA